MEHASYLPMSFYLRRAAREGTEAEAREHLLLAASELEFLRGWVREQGLIPPFRALPRGKVQDIVAAPVTEWQRQVADALADAKSV
jgi:hypothetical protein